MCVCVWVSPSPRWILPFHLLNSRLIFFFFRLLSAFFRLVCLFATPPFPYSGDSPATFLFVCSCPSSAFLGLVFREQRTPLSLCLSVCVCVRVTVCGGDSPSRSHFVGTAFVFVSLAAMYPLNSILSLSLSPHVCVSAGAHDE